jgi:ribonuclease HII
MGVRDSKLLTRKRRNELYAKIEELAEEVRTSLIYPEEINELMRKEVSLNEIEAMHFSRLLDETTSKIDKLYLDSPDVIPERFGFRVGKLTSKPTFVEGKRRPKGKEDCIRIISEHKADVRYPVVSAASVIAKVTRDRAIRKLERELGLVIGSGYPSDNDTIEAVRRNMGSGILRNHIRQRWITMERIRQTALSSFL